ncbi:MAG: hypothetical protein ACI3YE_03145, partial [Candidatus Avispirillum sp.]
QSLRHGIRRATSLCTREASFPPYLRLRGKYANFGSFGGFSPSTSSGYNRRANLRLCRWS